MREPVTYGQLGGAVLAIATFVQLLVVTALACFYGPAALLMLGPVFWLLSLVVLLASVALLAGAVKLARGASGARHWLVASGIGHASAAVAIWVQFHSYGAPLLIGLVLALVGLAIDVRTSAREGRRSGRSGHWA